MLPRGNRIVEPGDFRRVVRRGDKCVTDHLIAYRVGDGSARIGIVATNKCGNAITRNTLRRRTRAICRELVDSGALTGDVIVRFRCEGKTPDFHTLKAEIDCCVQRWSVGR